MEVLNLTQGSPEWLKARGEHDTASEAPAMMGASPHMTRDELLHFKKTGEEKERSSYVNNVIFLRGHELEGQARAILEGELSAELYPVTCAVEIDGLKLLASLDGINMEETIIFEHKQWNKTKAPKIKEKLPAEYYWQVEQQLLISGAEECYFIMSDGTEANRVVVHYTPVKGRAKKLIDGWKQFNKDLAEYTLPDDVVDVSADVIAPLPTLDIQVEGSVTSQNLTVYSGRAMAYIGAINTDLLNDQDFVDAEANIKFCREAESELVSAKKRAIAGNADINELMKAVDLLSDQLRAKRLILEKLVKSEKENIKRRMVELAEDAYSKHLGSLESELNGLSVDLSHDFWEPMKGKRTIESLNNAVNTKLAEAKIEANSVSMLMRKNLTLIDENNDHLFADLQSIITKPSDDFRLLVESRESKEQERLLDAHAKDTQEIEKQESLEWQAEETMGSGVEPMKPEEAIIPVATLMASFDHWFEHVGAGIGLRPEESHFDFGKRMARAAWEAASKNSDLF